MRSMATLVVAVLVAAPITADAHHERKQGLANHGRHSFARNLHRLASVAHDGKASPVSAEQNVETGPLQPITDFFEKGLASIWSGGWTSDGKRVHPLIWRAHTEPFQWARSSMSLMNGPRDLFWLLSAIADPTSVGEFWI